VIDAYREFATRVHLIGISDEQLRPDRISIARLTLSVVALALAGSALVAVTLIHLPAVVIVTVGTGVVRSTATKGTVRLLLGLITMLSTWVIAGIVLGSGWTSVAYAFAVAVGGAVALVVWPPLVHQAQAILAHLRTRNRAGLLGPVLTARSHVVAAVRASIGADHD
jgi:hypothetical protein